MGIILTFIAFFLVGMFTVPGIIYAFIRTKFKVGDYFFKFAIALDQLGNVTCQYLLNDIMIKKGGSEFGSPDETVSSCLGKNKISGHLTLIGKGLAHLLNFLQRDHVEKAIEKDEADDIKTD